MVGTFSRSVVLVIFLFPVLQNWNKLFSGVVPVSLSDHYLVYFVLKSGVTKAPPRTIEYHSYKNFNANSFMADLNNVPWHITESADNIDDAVLIWNKLFSEVTDLHAPVKRCRVNLNNLDSEVRNAQTLAIFKKNLYFKILA